jgi:hypothetical protein
MMTSLEPVARIPSVCHTSSIAMSPVGNNARAGQIPSSGPHNAPTMIQLPRITPVAHDHRPVSRTPSPVGTPRPVGARGAGARNGRVANASSWARSSNSASIQLCSA